MLAPAWASADDQQIAQQIASSLRSSGQLVDYSIGVKYENGTAWLLGRVASEEQRDRAIAMARKLPSVTDVVSKLEIKSSRAHGRHRANRRCNLPATAARRTVRRRPTRRSSSLRTRLRESAASRARSIKPPPKRRPPQPTGAAAATRKTASTSGAQPRSRPQVATAGKHRSGRSAGASCAAAILVHHFTLVLPPSRWAPPPARVRLRKPAVRKTDAHADPRRPAMRGNSQVAQVQAMQVIDGEGMP